MSVQLIVFPQTELTNELVVDGINFNTINTSSSSLSLAQPTYQSAINLLDPTMAINTWYRFSVDAIAPFEASGAVAILAYKGIMQKLSNSEVKVTEVISFILEQYRNEKVNQDLEVASELILIARILHQRFKISNGTQVKEDKSVILAKNEILKEIKDDEYYELIKNFIKDYRQFRDKNVN